MRKPGLRRIVALLLRLLLSLTFLYSAVAKLRPIEPFEYTLVESAWIGWGAAAWIARAIIGVELAFSLLLLIVPDWRYLRKALLIFLGGLSLYLIALLAQKGNVADCGCFGAAHDVSPLLSLLKNGIMVLAVLLIGHFGVGPSFRSYPRAIASFILIGGLAVPFILEPRPLRENSARGQKVESFPMDELRKAQQEHGDPSEGLGKGEGKRILAFMSTSCHWCRMAARKMGIIDEQSKEELPYHFFLHGSEESKKEFWEETRAGPYPSTLLPLDTLMKFADGRVPVLLLVEDGKARWRLGFRDIREERFRSFLKADRVDQE